MFTPLTRTASLALLLGLAAPIQAAMPNNVPSQAGPMVGAYQAIPVDAPEVQDARDFAQSRVPSFAVTRVNVAYTQVVAGLNIKLIATGLEEGRQETWKFVVYKNLDGSLALTLAERL